MIVKHPRRYRTQRARDIIVRVMKRLLVGLTVLVFLGGLGYLGLGRYKQQEFIESISPPIKNTSLRVANVATYETSEESKITFKELFDKLELDIGEIDKRILEVQTIASPSQKSVADLAVGYMRSSQDLLRTLLAKYRRSLSLDSASERAHRAAEEAFSSSGELFHYKVEAFEKAGKERTKAAAELSESVSDVLSSVKTLRGALARVATVANLRSDVLIDPAILEVIAKKNEPSVAVGAKPDSTVPANGPAATALPAAAPREASAQKAAPVHRAARVPTDQEEDERLRKQREQWVAETRQPSAEFVTLTQSDIITAMKAVQHRMQACAIQFEAQGTAVANINVASGGSVSSATVTGNFAGTPVGACVEVAAKSAKFPPCEATAFPWPITLSPR
jgi:hypothetical protein